ncbi:FeoA family protein [Seleniivibrio woodruffii]|uniref:Ferrous iron transport protein A n=1 Tax=Seleniivibrio woodruffii TaxID=1078050 RepID=A0A4R1KBG8_9BACT|nr:FeoA family protein [Seleniivibrio woodruffii]TCK61812.1 ferrous iron transport protein A [Seleniivibrio woodruffii]TVZ35073.1 ferrous iron transport protein A [Seleniivibrio woodruffii]
MTNACCEKTADTVQLSMMKAGSRGVIQNLVIDCEDKEHCRFARRLKEMGIYEGAKIEVSGNDGDGEIIAICEGTKIVLGRGMAGKIRVQMHAGALLDDTPFGRICRKFGIGCRI